MFFSISTTSDDSRNGIKPCKNAVVKEMSCDNKYIWEVEINTLEDLLELCAEIGGEIILSDINNHANKEPEFELEIYDDYRE